VEDLELGVLHPVQQHVHARQVVGGDVLFLAVNLADAVRPIYLAHVEQQRARAAGKVQHAVQMRALAGGFGSWLSSVTMADRMSEICCGV
jgi:tryptophanase